MTTATETYSVPRINDTAPDFTAETTQGTIHFHDWIGDGWAHPVLAPQGLHAGLHHRTRLPWRSCSRNSPSATRRSSV